MSVIVPYCAVLVKRFSRPFERILAGAFVRPLNSVGDVIKSRENWLDTELRCYSSDGQRRDYGTCNSWFISTMSVKDMLSRYFKKQLDDTTEN